MKCEMQLLLSSVAVAAHQFGILCIYFPVHPERKIGPTNIETQNRESKFSESSSCI